MFILVDTHDQLEDGDTGQPFHSNISGSQILTVNGVKNAEYCPKNQKSFSLDTKFYFSSLSYAQKMCNKYSDCGGLTFNHLRWELRSGRTFYRSPSREISYLKKRCSWVYNFDLLFLCLDRVVTVANKRIKLYFHYQRLFALEMGFIRISSSRVLNQDCHLV